MGVCCASNSNFQIQSNLLNQEKKEEDNSINEKTEKQENKINEERTENKKEKKHENNLLYNTTGPIFQLLLKKTNLKIDDNNNLIHVKN